VKLPGKGMSWKEFLKALYHEVSRDQLTVLAGSVTYSGVLALFPFLLFLVSVVSVIVTPEQAEGLAKQLGQVAPPDVSRIVGDRIRVIASDAKTGLLTFGALGALWAASSGVSTLTSALNSVYGVKEQRPFWKTRGLAVLMTFVSGVLALVAAVVAVASPALAALVGGPAGTAISWLRLPVAGLIMMLLWAILYYALPDVEQDFKFITPGSVAGVVIWVLASFGFSEYVTHFGSYEATYGSLGGIIVMLLWMWISSLVMLVGAEANAIIEHRSAEGKRAGAKSLADAGPSGTKTQELGPPDPSEAFGRGAAAARAAERARARAVAGLTALLAGIVWLRRREA
jgi:membrane protein